MTRLAIRLALVPVLASAMVACGGSSAGTAGEPGAAAGNVPPAAGAMANPNLTMLPIHAYQQTTSYTCGPSSLLTLLRYYGRDGDEMTIADEAKCSPQKGTNPDNMVAWLEHHGFQVTWGEHGSLDLLRRNLGRGVPTLVEWIDYGGHWVLAVGYDTRGTETDRDDVIYFADPADGHDGNRDGLTSFNAHRFDAMWFDAFLFDRPMFKVYITAVPQEG